MDGRQSGKNKHAGCRRKLVWRRHPRAGREAYARMPWADVATQSTAIPTRIQQLFDDAGSRGGLSQTATLRGQIARFLHKHKVDDFRLSLRGLPTRNAPLAVLVLDVAPVPFRLPTALPVYFCALLAPEWR